MNSVQSPVFVVGSARSGTSLVYSILMASNVYTLYAAETLLLRTCADKYGRLTQKSIYEKFIQDWLKSKQFLRSGLNREVFIRNAIHHKSSYLEFLDYFMTAMSLDQNKSYWAENTPNHVLEISNIAKYFPQSRFLHVIRDGRAVATSLNKLNWVSSKQAALRLMSAGIHWETHVVSGRKQGRKLGKRYMEIYYEELIRHPNKVLCALSDFIGTNIDLQMLQNNRYGVLGKTNTVYNEKQPNDNKLFSADALSRWKTTLSAKDQAILNTVIGDTLQSFGYSVGKKISVNQFSVIYCKFMYHLKEWLRHETILGRNAKTGLELDE